MLLDRPTQSSGRVKPAGAVTCNSTVYGQRSPGKIARSKVGNLLGRLGASCAATPSRKSGTGKDSSPPRPAREPAANGLQLDKREHLHPHPRGGPGLPHSRRYRSLCQGGPPSHRLLEGTPPLWSRRDTSSVISDSTNFFLPLRGRKIPMRAIKLQFLDLQLFAKAHCRYGSKAPDRLRARLGCFSSDSRRFGQPLRPT